MNENGAENWVIPTGAPVRGAILWRSGYVFAPGTSIWRRPGRVLAGVCDGVARTLQISVFWVRFMFVLWAFTGIPVIIYAAMWLLIPDERQKTEKLPYIQLPSGEKVLATQYPSSRSRLAPQLNAPTAAKDVGNRTKILPSDSRLILLGMAISLLCAAVYLRRIDPSGDSQPQLLTLIAAGAVMIVGLLLGWLNAGRVQVNTNLLLAGIGIAILGSIMLVSAIGFAIPLYTAVAIVILVALNLTLILTPLWVTLRAQLLQAQAVEIQARTRADTAAHLHDSVLQTLALIQQSQSDPDRVRTLARSEEKQLRQWLYGEGRSFIPGDDHTLEDLFTELIAELEKTYNAKIDLVYTGVKDCPTHRETVIAITREAINNALKHGSSPVDVFVENDRELEIFVRDRGPGFDLGDMPEIPQDRRGIRDSILARSAELGGKVKYRKLQSGGTEFHLKLPKIIAEGNENE